MDMKIVGASLEDMKEILALQKSAYRSEAEIYNDYSIPPLVQTMDEIKDEFGRKLFLKAISRDGIIGSIRAHTENGVCYIGRLIVDSSIQNKGVGGKLLAEIEKRFSSANRFELFTGDKSEKNRYFYKKYGYVEFGKEAISDELTLIYFEKTPLPRSIP